MTVVGMLGIFYFGVTIGWSMASLVAAGRKGHPHPGTDEMKGIYKGKHISAA